jgi:hypothetical protein
MKLYPFFAKRVYRRIEIYQSRHDYRLPLVSLAGRHGRVDNYAMYTQYFSFVGNLQSDDFITFPILCLSLYRMENLLELDVLVARSSSPFLLECMERYQLINSHIARRGLEPSRNTRCINHTMTRLRSLRFRQDSEILGIFACRNITSLTLTSYLGYSDIEDMIFKLEEMDAGRHITELSLRLHPSIEVDRIIYAIGDAMPSLLLLSINRARLNPMVR